MTLNALLLIVIAACPSPEMAQEQLAEIQRPQDLDQLDMAVRLQFEEVWKALRDPENEPRSEPEAATAWGTLGQWFDVYRYDTSAAACYNNARLLDPLEPRWPFLFGLLAEKRGELDLARENFAYAASLAPEAAEPRVNLGNLALRQQNLDQAELIFAELLAADPESPGALFGFGRLALLRGDATSAVEILEKLSRLQPDAAQVHYSLGQAWRQLGNEQRALEHLRQVPEDNLLQIPLILDAPWERELQLMDRGSRTLNRQGVSAFRRGNKITAIILLGRSVAADPTGPEKRINYGVALRETGHWQAAEEQFTEAIRLSEDRSELRAKAHLELARLLMDRNRRAAAATHLETSLAIDPLSLPAHLELGRLYHSEGRLEEALNQYAAARENDSALAGTRFWYAALLILLDRHDQAIQSIEVDFQELGDDRELRLLLARLLSSAPDTNLHDLKRARQLIDASDQAPDVLFAESAAMVAAATGQFTEAVAWQNAAIKVLADIRPRSSAQTARRRLVLYQRGEACRNPWEIREAQILKPVTTP